MRLSCENMALVEEVGPYASTFAGRLAAQQYVDIVKPAYVLLLLDMGKQMTDAVEKIDDLVKSAGFDNLEQALRAIERIGKVLHGRD